MSKPLFSVVIPTYNRAEKLLRSLRSLNEQTFLNFEVLVCDDGSTDHTSVVVEEFRSRARFSRLLYFMEPNWGGPARPRNRGISASSAEWVCFLDSDDSWYPDKLVKILPYIGEYDLIYHDFDLMSVSGKPRPLRSRKLKGPVFHDLMLNGHNGCIINSGVCVRRSLLENAGGFSENPTLISVEDADIWLRIARMTDRFKYVPLRLGMYYFDGDNITIYNQCLIDKLQFLFSEHAYFLPDERIRQLAARTNNYHLGRITQAMGYPARALVYYWSSLGSPNLRLSMRSLYWILYIAWKRLLSKEKQLNF